MSLKTQLKSLFERSKAITSQNLKIITAFARSSRGGLTAWLRENCSRFWFLAQLACLIVIYLVYRKWPTMPVGFAIGAAGVVAAGMTLRDGRWKAVEKFLWIVIISGLWVTDVHNIFREQKTHDAEQKVISDSLKDTQIKLANAQDRLADTQSKLSAAISQLDVISRNEGKTLELTTENQNQLTGGDSFCYIDFTHFVDGPRLINGGKYPLHAISITVKNLEEGKKLWDRIPQAQFHPEWDLERDYKTFAEVTLRVGDLGPYDNVPAPSVPILQRDHEKILDIIFSAGKGYVIQHTCLRHATNSLPPRYLLAAATKVTTRGKLRKLDVDQNYPKEENGDVGCFSTKAKQ